MLSKQPEFGSTANSYAILAKLATGGMAEIFLARTASSANVERYVVLKRIHRHRASDAKFVNMFLDEARLAAQLQHPNIAQVYDTGRLGDSYFFTMEYVHGETVRELLHRAYALGQAIPLTCALTIIAGATAGLQHAHERINIDGKPLAIVHRDVSPSNLMVTFEGAIKVVDFGVAKASDRSTETQSGTVKGKIGYMSPEQCRGGDVDQRCDLFSLGIVMWELLTGTRLFKRATDFESMEAVVDAEAPLPSSKRPDVPKELDAIVAKLLAKAPIDRYQSAGELLEDIETAAVRTGIGISTAALRRFVRELFGQRPEPWVELTVREANPEVITVTGAPVLKSDTLVSPVDEQLDRLVDLSSVTADPLPIPDHAAPVVRLPRAPTTPTVSASQPMLAVRASDRLALVGGAKASDRLAAAAPTTTNRLAQVAAVREARGSWPDGSSPEAIAALGSSDGAALATDVASPSSRWLLWTLLLVAGMALGTIGWFVTRDTDASSTPTAAAAPTTTTATPPAAPPHASDPPAAPGSDPVASPDPPKIDTTGPAAADPAVKPTADTPPAKPPRSPTKVGSERPALDVVALFRANRFDEVVSACDASPRLVASAIQCAIAACRRHDEAKARRWYAAIPAARRSIIKQACEVAGVGLDAKRPAPPTEPPPDPKPEPPKCDPNDPMSCRE